MRLPTYKRIWLSIGIFALALVVASLVLTAQLHLHPCHLCIVQRLLFILLGAFGLLAAIGLPRVFGGLSMLASATGIGVASYQVWLQAQPADPFSCTSGTPGWAEHLVDWLGRQAPDLFLATGLCQDVELTILKLSLAQWALVAYSAALIAGIVAMRFKTKRPRG